LPRGTAALGGAAIMVGGAVALATLPEVECDPGDGCIDLTLGTDRLAHDVQVAVGVGALIAGAALLILAVAPLAPPPTRAPDPGACIEWERALAAESDPGRRRQVAISRPAHCAPPAAALSR
jgi:hypothetical protein